jgi:hypothetical protein
MTKVQRFIGNLGFQRYKTIGKVLGVFSPDSSGNILIFKKLEGNSTFLKMGNCNG